MLIERVVDDAIVAAELHSACRPELEDVVVGVVARDRAAEDAAEGCVVLETTVTAGSGLAAPSTWALHAETSIPASTATAAPHPRPDAVFLPIPPSPTTSERPSRAKVTNAPRGRYPLVEDRIAKMGERAARLTRAARHHWARAP
ncbi:MAG: hypothetical protein ACXVXP_08270 [Mycobacteriaceae bacterium]